MLVGYSFYKFSTMVETVTVQNHPIFHSVFSDIIMNLNTLLQLTVNKVAQQNIF